MTDYERLISMTSRIKNDAIRNFTLDKLAEGPEYFKTIPASSTGKYHPSYALGEGGLVRHTIAVVKILDHIMSLEYLNLKQRHKDRLLSSAFLHDLYKQGNGEAEGHTVRDHAKIASEIIKGDTDDSKFIANSILAHMGQWGLNKPQSVPQFLLHLADYLASRKDLEVLTNE